MKEFFEVIMTIITYPSFLMALAFGITLTVGSFIGAQVSHTKKKHDNDKPFVDDEPEYIAGLEIEIEKLENKTFNVHILSDDTEMESQHLSEIDFDTLKKCISNTVDEFKTVNDGIYDKRKDD